MTEVRKFCVFYSHVSRHGYGFGYAFADVVGLISVDTITAWHGLLLESYKEYDEIAITGWQELEA
jgi:hypothetical protein